MFGNPVKTIKNKAKDRAFVSSRPFASPSRARRGAGSIVAGAIVLASLCVAGCAPLPAMSPAAQPKSESSYQSSASFAAPSGEWPQKAWWGRYKDPQLGVLIEEGLRDAPSVAVAQARLDRSYGQLGEQRSALFPSVAGNGSLASQKQSYNNGVPAEFVPQGWNGTGQATLNFSYEIDFWGKNRAALAAATSQAEAAEADAAQARVMLSTSIADAYGELARLCAQEDTAKAALDVRRKNAELFAERQANGLETLGSVKQAQSRQASSAANLMAIEESIALQKNRLAALMGEGPDRGLRVERPSPQALDAFGLPASIPLNLIGRRPDVLAAKLRAQAAEKSVKAAKADFYPNVDLTAFIGVESLGISNLFRSGSGIGSVGPAISLPIFNAGRIQGQYRVAQADANEAVANYDQAVTQALHEVADAAVSERALEPQIKMSQESVDEASDAYDSAKSRYTGGLSNYLA